MVLAAGCGTTVSTSAGGTALSGASAAPGAATSGDAGLSGPAATAPGATSGAVAPGTVAAPGASAGPAIGPTGSGSVPTGATQPTGSGRVTGPISLGFIYAVNDAAAPAGINNGNTITPGRVIHGLVQSWNKTGGIGGRRIAPVYAELHSYNNNYEAQIAAACAAFTQDNHVVAVLMEVQYYSEQLLTCLQRAQVPLISGDFVAPDRQDAQKYPILITPLSQVGEDREASVVRHLAADGFLSGHNRVGVIVEDCPVDDRIYSNGLVPALRDAHLTLASTFHAQCFQSVQDFGTQTSQMSSAVLQFRQDRVDRVMVVSAAAEANIVFAFSEVADNQGYEPGYALSSVAAPQALQLNASARQMQNMRGVGWLPVVDTTSRSQSQPTAAGSQCLQRLRSQGVVPQTQPDRWFAYSGCETFTLYDALLRATGGNSAASYVLGAVPQVARSYSAVATVDGREGMHGGRLGPSTGRVFAYDSTHKFHYVSGLFPL